MKEIKNLKLDVIKNEMTSNTVFDLTLFLNYEILKLQNFRDLTPIIMKRRHYLVIRRH